MTYPRCFLLTLGSLFAGLAMLGIVEISGSEEKPPDWLPPLLFCMAILGLFLMATGFFGSRKDAESLAETSSRHEASLVVMVIAAPLYFLLKALEKRRK